MAKFTLKQVISLAGGPKKLREELERRGFDRTKYAVLKWGRDCALPQKYIDVVVELTPLDREEVVAANEAFKSELSAETFNGTA
ncbi:conserved hypothetical protein [Roseibium sp. TrichSKD4]|uniref:hypothetical protein n=1 Tax=Roseibium sp. TrichSKD4 TaxID=744980 RepID=UPI0001E56B57|nr:hypothetical protein [Roseibium sp. TrichSKD4]EFO30131.1 conserved hypothetical protein [Roseibium sp. TrichSKD4]